MTIGTSLFLLAAGAILKYAVQDSIDAVNLATVGVILMIVGGIGLLLSLLYMSVLSRDRHDTGHVREREYGPR